MTDCEVIRQIERAGYRACLNRFAVSGDGLKVVGNVQVKLVELLKLDTAFKSGPGYGYHRDVGPDLSDFRSINGSFGKGSLQFVISKVTGDFYADVDAHNPYQDVARFVGHTGELVTHFFRRFRRKSHENS